MNSSYTREQLRPDCVRFVVTGATYTKEPGRPYAAIAAGLIFGLLVYNSGEGGFFSTLFHLIFGIGGGYAVYRGVKWYTDKKSQRGGMPREIVVSGDGVQTYNGQIVQRHDIVDINWTNWDPTADDQCALYLTVGESPVILAGSMDEETVKRLAADAAKVLGVSAREHKVDVTKGTEEGGRQMMQSYQERLDSLRNGAGVTSEQQSIEEGDAIIKEVKRNSFKIFVQTGAGRDLVMDDPGKDPFVVFELAKSAATDSHKVWFERTSGGPLLLVSKELPSYEAYKAVSAAAAAPAAKPFNADRARDDLLDKLSQPQPPSAAEEEQKAQARKKLDDIRKQYAGAIVTSEMQPMQTGDLILMEVTPNVWEIHEIKESGRERVMPVALNDMTKIIQFGEAYAGGRNMWFSKLSDKGPAVLMVNANDPD